MIRTLSAAILLTLAVGVAQAQADPCQAIPDSGPAPSWVKPGATFGGKVRFVIDGDGLCVGNSPDPKTWVEVRLSDLYAPELSEPGGQFAKATLSRLAMGRQAQCRIEGGKGGRARSYDRLLAVCRVNGRSLGAQMRAAGIDQGGRGYGNR